MIDVEQRRALVQEIVRDLHARQEAEARADMLARVEAVRDEIARLLTDLSDHLAEVAWSVRLPTPVDRGQWADLVAAIEAWRMP